MENDIFFVIPDKLRFIGAAMKIIDYFEKRPLFFLSTYPRISSKIIIDWFFYNRRKPMRFAITILVFLFSAPAGAEKIMLISDPQYGWFGRTDCKKERESFQKIINVVNEEKFDALIILGDLADSYPRKRGRRDAQVGLFLEDIEKIKSAHVFFAAGNHDMAENPTAETMKRFERTFDVPLWYVFHIGGYKFLVINTTLLRDYKRLPQRYEEQIKFIEKNRDARFVLGHHPMFYKRPTEDNKYYSWPVKTRNYILSLFPPGTFFFSGHTHRPFQKITNGIRSINAGTCCAPWRGGRRSYGVLETDGEAVRYTEKTLE